MFWRMTGLSTASPVDSILDKENYSLEELLDEDEIIQECKALNTRLINFLRERTQVEKLLRYIVEEAPDDAEKKRSFKFSFIACEIFTCEVDIILRALVEDEELMNLLFSFLKPDHSHSTLLAGYFSKVVICLMLRKTVPLMNYVQAHQEIFHQLVDLIGITSIMEVLIRLIGADEHMYSNYMEAMQWLEDTDVLEMIVDKFSSSDSPEVHANAAEILCTITRYAPPGLAAKISSPSFVGRLFRIALEDSRPKSVLVHSLTVCISLLDPKRLLSNSYYSFRSHMTHGSSVTANPEMVDGMLESIGDLSKLLDVSSPESVLPTTYGSLQPPLGKHRLKIIEFISVLLTTGSEAAENVLIQIGAIRRILDLFFEYPFNNFLHHHVENIVVSCLESKRMLLLEHLMHECDIVGKINEAEKNSTLSTDSNGPTFCAEGRSPPRIGNIGHITRIANKLIQLGNDSTLQSYLQDNNEWTDWHTNVLLKRNAVENVYQWACGRPAALHDRSRDSDDEDFRDRDYDVTALANNLSQAFRYGIYSNEDIEEAHGSLERDDEDVYFDDESAEVVISSLRLGDDQDSGSLFTNSNWFTFEDDRVVNEQSTASRASPSPSPEETDEVVLGDNIDLTDTPVSLQLAESGEILEKPGARVSENGIIVESGGDPTRRPLAEGEKLPEWVEWRETPDTAELPEEVQTPIPNGEIEAPAGIRTVEDAACVSKPSDSSGNDGGVGEDISEFSGPNAASDLPESVCRSAGDGARELNGISSPEPTSIEDAEIVGPEDAVEASETKEVDNEDGK
uniref:Serine/threonine-protein phosphatase 6 regulatory subunit 3 n=1 Tax=Anthurium amnicola TaxID=1678845 RepID=A0A1D1Y0D9_9ARAE